MIPSGLPQLLIFAAFVMPGFIFQAARVRFRGQLPGERDQFSRALRALGISFAFDLIYYASFSGTIQATAANPELIAERPVKAALVALAIVFAVPIICALLDFGLCLRADERLRGASFWRATVCAAGKLFVPVTYRLYNSTPSSWDFAARRLNPAWIRVQYSDHVWMGGYFGTTGFINATPESRELYLEEGWQLGETGEFEKPINDSLGIWVNCTNAIAVEYIAAAYDNENPQEDQDDDREPVEPDGWRLDEVGEQVSKTRSKQRRLSTGRDAEAQASHRGRRRKSGLQQRFR